MAKNDRFVVRHEEGWAVKKTKAGRASSLHATQREAEKGQRKSLITLEMEVRFREKRTLQRFRHDQGQWFPSHYLRSRSRGQSLSRLLFTRV